MSYFHKFASQYADWFLSLKNMINACLSNERELSMRVLYWQFNLQANTKTSGKTNFS